MDFVNVKALNKYVIKAINDILEDISFDIELELRHKVREAYISDRSRDDDPEYYTPTFDFLNSISRAKPVPKNGVINIEVYFDPKKMPPEMRNDELWNAHMGMSGQYENVYNGMSVSELLPFWIEYGTKKGLFQRKGTDSVGKVFKLYEDIFPKLLKLELEKRYGIKTN